MKKLILACLCFWSFTGYSETLLFDQLSIAESFTTLQKTIQLAKIAENLEIPFESVPTFGDPVLQFFFQGKWNILDTRNSAFYIQLDNKTLADFDEIAHDPFLVLRTKVNAKNEPFDLSASQKNLAHFKIAEIDEWPTWDMLVEEWEPLFSTEGIYSPQPQMAVSQIGQDPLFILSASDCELIRWQISSDNNFNTIPTNLDQIQPYTKILEIDPLSETFLNPNQNYFFRIKTFQGGVWSTWSLPLIFNVAKPEKVQAIEFNKCGNQYTISWKGDSSTYLVYGSNALDFIPPIYAHSEIPYTCFATDQQQVEIDPSYAYYRIIPLHNGKYGTPSEIIYIYDQGMHHPRTLLQTDCSSGTISRKPLPSYYEDRGYSGQEKQSKSVKPSHVSSEIWAAVEPYLLPENHPLKGRMDRIFSKSRVLANEKSLTKAGFVWPKKEVSHSGIYPTQHEKIKKFYVKILTDEQDIADWRQWVNRAQGARDIRNSIDAHHYERVFKVPKKFIYPLPEKPETTPDVKRKNFVLLSEDMKIVDHDLNRELYRNRVTKILLNAIYEIVTELGLADSLFIHNLCWAKDGRLAFVDTERHHCWPVVYRRYFRILSAPMLDHWKLLIKHNGPNF